MNISISSLGGILILIEYQEQRSSEDNFSFPTSSSLDYSLPSFPFLSNNLQTILHKTLNLHFWLLKFASPLFQISTFNFLALLPGWFLWVDVPAIKYVSTTYPIQELLVVLFYSSQTTSCSEVCCTWTNQPKWKLWKCINCINLRSQAIRYPS